MKKTFAIALLLFMVSASTSFAQTRTGTTGARNTGSGAGSGGLTNFGSSGFGSTAGGGAAGGLGGGGTGQGFTFNSGLGMGASPMGAGGMGRTGMMGMGGMGMMGMGGMGMGGMGMGMGGMGMGRAGGMGGRGGAAGQQGNQQRYQIRPTVKLGFDVALPSSQQRTQQFTSTIARLPQSERFQGINVKVDGRKAIATGKLISKNDANLLKNLLLMEPGVYEVDVSALIGEKSSASPSDKASATAAEQVPAVPSPK